MINDKRDCALVSSLVYESLSYAVKDLKNYILIGITATSYRIIKSLESQGLISSDDYITLDNYHAFENDLNSEIVSGSKGYILICDVISSGYLTTKLNNKLHELGAKIEYIAVVVSILDACYGSTQEFLKEFDGKIIKLYEHPIKKYTKKELNQEIFNKNIIRINPHTTIPITLSLDETYFNSSVIFKSDIIYDEVTNQIHIKNPFIESISKDDIRIGYYKFNNVIHPYFFETNSILSQVSEEALREIVKTIDKESLKREKLQVFYPRNSGMERFDFSLLKKVLGNHLVEEIVIERIGTPEGWRFPHNIDYLQTQIENNVCFILDDGSCTGDSLVQMIDEISFYDAKEIILLCFIGRVNDHKREFFSRVSQVKIKGSKSIPLSIYFATHWHIPTYYIDENPNSNEIIWLEQLISLPNTPRSIRKIANNIKNEITPKSGKDFRDYKYLPHLLGGGSIIPKKEMVLIREELGKVVGYRLYKESFKFFDYFIRKYETRKESKDRYLEIELLCATIIYEPYLYDKITGIMPDVAEKIEDFVRVLIFKDNRIFSKLTFEWHKKDIVHLFFIVFRNDKLINELTISNFVLLITFTQPTEPVLSYVLYKLLSYFPIHRNQFENKRYDVHLKSLLFELKEGDSAFKRELSRFYNFIASLPSREDFHSQLSSLRDMYNKQKAHENHDAKSSFNHNVSLAIVNLRQCVEQAKSATRLHPANVNVIRTCWVEMLNFIVPILEFSSSYKAFLMPFPYFKMVNTIENGNSSLRGMVGFNEDVIFSLDEEFNDVEKLQQLAKNIQKIQDDFEVNSIFYQLVDKPDTNLKEFIVQLSEQIKALSFEVEIGKANLDPKVNLKIPKYYVDHLIIKELVTNIKNHSKKQESSKVSVQFGFKENNSFQVEIKNPVLQPISSNSNGEGIKCLNLLAEFDLFGFSYSNNTVKSEFIQILSFKC